MIAAACLVLAGIGRLMGWPAALPPGALLGALLILAGYFFAIGRTHDISDAEAAAIDADGGFGGELRSATWFATRDRRDDWVDLHIDRASDRLAAVDWVRLYPHRPARRAHVTTLLLVLATVAMVTLLPERAGLRSQTSAQAKRDANPLDALTHEMQQQLEELLAAAEQGTLGDGEHGMLASAEVRELLSRLAQLRDAEALKDLARAMDLNASKPDAARSAQEMKALADRLRHAAEMNPSAREFREAMDDLARNLSDAAAAEELASKESSPTATPDSLQGGDAGKTTAESRLDEASIQAVREAQAPAGSAGTFMMSNQQAAASATPGFGIGGGGSTTGEAKALLDVNRALRQETIEASADNAGANVNTEIRRKTEQGQASATFTGAASGRSDRSRASAAPAVPESRRSDVQRYFTRKQ